MKEYVQESTATYYSCRQAVTWAYLKGKGAGAGTRELSTLSQGDARYVSAPQIFVI